MKKRHIQKMILLSILLLAAFNMPLVWLFNSSVSVFGLPVIYMYFFSLFFISAVVSFVIFKRYDE
ncbi:hypothetical protein [Flavobacterium silvaticum]|uniref:DUF3311 domain-containing protein n=1 Tax=Flavobacterium silvaticum TaxID=1852020 RepID=A0A972FUX0_9FLAO|nr:hypothetical protein [Flavobacterium silvaticum]NMH28988.1 hypothetical protein [Flavobacterium silvaticum]